MKIQKFKTIRILITALMFLTGTLVITSGAQAADSRYYVSMEAPAQTQYGTDNAVISWKLSYISSSNTTETADTTFTWEKTTGAQNSSQKPRTLSTKSPGWRTERNTM